MKSFLFFLGLGIGILIGISTVFNTEGCREFMGNTSCVVIGDQ